MSLARPVACWAGNTPVSRNIRPGTPVRTSRLLPSGSGSLLVRRTTKAAALSTAESNAHPRSEETMPPLVRRRDASVVFRPEPVRPNLPHSVPWQAAQTCRSSAIPEWSGTSGTFDAPATPSAWHDMHSFRSA